MLCFQYYVKTCQKDNLYFRESGPGAVIINAGGGPEDSLGGGNQKCINHLWGGATKNIKESRGGTKNNVQ